jgi:hypothetical protein
VAGDPVRRRRRVTHSWVTLEIAQPQIHRVRNLRREVRDVGVEVAVIGRREEQLRVVVDEHEAHVVDRADRVRRPEVPFQQLQEATKPLRSAFHERKEHGELRNLALTGADTAGGLRRRRRCQLFREHGEPVLQRGFAQFRRVGVKLPAAFEASALRSDRVCSRSLVAVCVAIVCYLLLRSARTRRDLVATRVEEFFNRLADALQPSGLRHRSDPDGRRTSPLPGSGA